MSKWDLSIEETDLIDKNELLNNRELALSKMLPKENQNLLILKREFGFHLSTLVREYDNLQMNLSKRFKTHFLYLSERNVDLLSTIFNMVKLLTGGV
jgi:hypothetical protein